jgi:hypothetical protein
MNKNLAIILKKMNELEKHLNREDVYRAKKLLQTIKKSVIREINNG